MRKDGIQTRKRKPKKNGSGSGSNGGVDLGMNKKEDKDGTTFCILLDFFLFGRAQNTIFLKSFSRRTSLQFDFNFVFFCLFVSPSRSLRWTAAECRSQNEYFADRFAKSCTSDIAAVASRSQFIEIAALAEPFIVTVHIVGIANEHIANTFQRSRRSSHIWQFAFAIERCEQQRCRWTAATQQWHHHIAIVDSIEI